MLRFFLTACGLLLALTLGGCESAPRMVVKRNTTVALLLDKTRTVVNAKVGDLVKLELPPVELKGYGWQVYALDTRFLRQTTDIIPPATPEGRASLTVFVMEIVAKTSVRFLLVPQDGAKVSQPIDGHDVVFSVQ